jgi:hypothetical protein
MQLDIQFFNIEVNKNSLTFELLKPIQELKEYEVDNINLAIMEALSLLNPLLDIRLVHKTELPIAVWLYLITIPDYMSRSKLIITTPENLDDIKQVVTNRPNLLIMNP